MTPPCASCGRPFRTYDPYGGRRQLLECLDDGSGRNGCGAYQTQVLEHDASMVVRLICAGPPPRPSRYARAA